MEIKDQLPLAPRAGVLLGPANLYRVQRRIRRDFSAHVCDPRWPANGAVHYEP